MDEALKRPSIRAVWDQFIEGLAAAGLDVTYSYPQFGGFRARLYDPRFACVIEVEYRTVARQVFTRPEVAS